MKNPILWAIVILIIGGLAIRIIPHLSHNLTDSGILFSGVDSYYHLYRVEYSYNNFPAFMQWDPLSGYPGGRAAYTTFLLSWIIAGIALALHLPLEAVALYLPPLLGALCVIPAYFIGKTLWSRRTGIIIAAFTVFMPSELMYRSLFGHTDHHVLEILLSLSIIAFVLKAERDKQSLAILYTVSAGVCMGLFYLTWAGAIVISAILVLWLLIKHNHRIAWIVGSVNGIALIVSGWYVADYAILAMALSILVWWVTISWGKGKLRIAIPILVLLAVLGSGWFQILRFCRIGLSAVTSANDLLIGEGMAPTVYMMLLHYGLFIIAGLVGLFILIYRRQHVLIIIWCALWFFMMFLKVRWDYYATTSIAISSGFLLYAIWHKINKARLVKAVVVGVLVVILIASVYPGMLAIGQARPKITQNWHNALIWLGENSPEYQRELPEYGVLSWWDYGYWIIAESHRAPLSSPGRQKPSYSKFFTATNYDDAMKAIRNRNVRYVIIDGQMMMGKYYAIAMYSGYQFNEWTQVLSGSYADRLYSGMESTGFELVYQSGDVKIFEIGGDGN